MGLKNSKDVKAALAEVDKKATNGQTVGKSKLCKCVNCTCNPCKCGQDGNSDAASDGDQGADKKVCNCSPCTCDPCECGEHVKLPTTEEATKSEADAVHTPSIAEEEHHNERPESVAEQQEKPETEVNQLADQQHKEDKRDEKSGEACHGDGGDHATDGNREGHFEPHQVEEQHRHDHHHDHHQH